MTDSIAVQQDGRLLDFTMLPLKERLITYMERFFKDRAIGRHLLVRRVLPSIPTTPEILPCLIIRQVGDSVEKQGLGLEFSDEEDDVSYDAEGAYWREAFEVRYLADNVELRDRMRALLRAAIQATFRPFDEWGAQLPEVSGGSDEEDFSEQAPQELYMVSYQVSYQVPVVGVGAWFDKAEGVDVGATLEERPADPLDMAWIGRLASIGSPQ